MSRTGFKRLVVLCDGTWKESYDKNGIDESTNVTRLTRAIDAEDKSVSPHIPQIIFYQSGLGSSGADKLLAGATGFGIVEKIKDAYEFLVQNWLPGDEIFLFGFSRGAYTARMVGTLIGDVGILEPAAMDEFNDFFEAYQNLGKEDPEEKVKAEEYLSVYRPGGSKATRPMPKGTLKCIGVWDTVGALGIPGFTNPVSNHKLLGFVDTKLGKRVEYAFHALAIDETRKDFLPTKWHQPEEQRKDGQVMKQVWFSGAHSDIGGGYIDHELSDITLVWMVASILEHKLLSVNVDYVLSIPSPKLPWGELKPHDPRSKGWMALSAATVRPLPEKFNESTQELYHPSVYARKDLDHNKIFRHALSEESSLVTKLLPLEIELKSQWSIDGKKSSQAVTVNESVQEVTGNGTQLKKTSTNENEPGTSKKSGEGPNRGRFKRRSTFGRLTSLRPKSGFTARSGTRRTSFGFKSAHSWNFWQTS
ncbi:hypothetical protein CROQUDRAFT_658458 [Cronartium quercuum f. sp. fusiforme G11]|uniref:T6SS Phospholipase effector Tle1-like catalytic domain-containing protein n=1 Tax=Cronartium quercuum f. sp. fusiforme G11 TaxID=708437 RepID=A0A9P6TBD5_9BASI|nr:hypothetical protein CROQUDRAFT_658458 [Cronartium quercuum f. sp. fusiforme G11]